MCNRKSSNGSRACRTTIFCKDLFLWTNCLSANKLLNGSSLDALAKTFGGGESSLGSAVVENGKLTDAYLKLGTTGKDIYDFPSEPLDLISSGKYLMRRDKFDDAIAMFEMSATFPLQPGDRSYAYELIGDAWLKKGDSAMTAFYYEKALEANPGNKNARGKLFGLKR
jgi:tetratricopeptide (TPR) repeat protein